MHRGDVLIGLHRVGALIGFHRGDVLIGLHKGDVLIGLHKGDGTAAAMSLWFQLPPALHTHTLFNSIQFK